MFVLFSFKLIILPSNSKKEYLLFFLKIIPRFAEIICDSFFSLSYSFKKIFFSIPLSSFFSTNIVRSDTVSLNCLDFMRDGK